MTGNVQVKKVKPYPFEINIYKNGKVIPGKVLKLTMVGLMADMKHEVLKVGDIWPADFTLPVVGHRIEVELRVIKTFDRFAAGPGRSADSSVAERIVELHFNKISDEQKRAVNRFLVTIKQGPMG